MAWDDTKSPGDLIASSDYNSGVTDQKTRGVPQTDNKRGSNCTGSSPDSNRTLTLDNATIKSTGIVVIKNGTGLHETADYTVTSNVITFLSSVWDTDYIGVIYFT